MSLARDSFCSPDLPTYLETLAYYATHRTTISSDQAQYYAATCSDGDEARFSYTPKKVISPTAGVSQPKVRPLASQTSSGGPYALSAVTPLLPFIGNQTVMTGVILSADGTNLFSTGLRRQSNCSLALDIVKPGTSTPSASYVASLSGAEDYLHRLAGLPTKTNAFPQGCGDPSLGLVSVQTAFPLGQTTKNLALVANLNFFSDALELSIADSSANTFSTKALTADSVFSFYVADLNGDGLNDIVADGAKDPATQQLAVAVFIGQSDGTFQPAKYYAIADGASFFTVDDVNADGKPDLVIGSFSGGVTTFLGNGDGTFRAGVSSAPSGPAAGLMLATGDFNGDGKKDLFVQGTVLFGAGDGTFSVGPTIPYTLLPGSGAFVAAADLNHDGKIDVAISADGYVQIVFGVGDGTFRAGPAYASVPTATPLTITDMDGDGQADILVGHSSQALYVPDSDNPLVPMIQVLLGRGDGTFAGAPVYGGPRPSAHQTSAPRVALGDFLGNGHLQILTGEPISSNGTSSVVLAVTPVDSGTTAPAVVTSPVKVAPSMVVTADLNGDGKLDAVTAGFGGAAYQLAVLFNQGSGSLGGEQDYVLTNSPINLAVGDFNGDGRMDIALAVVPPSGETGASGVYVLFGQSGGTFAAPLLVDSSVTPAALAVGDLNGDGRADLVVGDQGTSVNGKQTTGLLHVYFGNANGTFTTVPSPTTSAAFYTAAALGDLDGDGTPDLIAAGTVVTTNGVFEPNLYWLKGNGDGTFQAAQREPLAGTDYLGATSLTLADFNGDGTPDIAVGNPNDFTEVILSQGSGTFIHTLMALGQRPQSMAAGASTGSGFADLVLSADYGTVLFRNPGSATAWATGGTNSPSSVSLSLNLLGHPQPAFSGASPFTLTWPTNAVGFTLESTTNLDATPVWTTVISSPVVLGGRNTVSNDASGAKKFFRLRK